MILKNAIKTPDGTILESTHRHDFQCHLDANGKEYCIDGGLSYLRRIGDTQDCEDLSIESTDISVIREYLTWGTYGKDGKNPLTRKKLKDLSNDHIENILLLPRVSPTFIFALTEELKYRKNNHIKIEDDL